MPKLYYVIIRNNSINAPLHVRGIWQSTCTRQLRLLNYMYILQKVAYIYKEYLISTNQCNRMKKEKKKLLTLHILTCRGRRSFFLLLYSPCVRAWHPTCNFRVIIIFFFSCQLTYCSESLRCLNLMNKGIKKQKEGIRCHVTVATGSYHLNIYFFEFYDISSRHL